MSRPNNSTSNRYAVMRTRFQPFNNGHHWAIKRYFDHVSNDNVFGSDALWLAIVDPDLFPTKESKTHRRSSKELNPLTEWQVSEQLHMMTCRRGFYCPRIAQTRIPSFMRIYGLPDRKKRVRAFNRILARLPKNHVWYFPVFDQDDITDIKLVWELEGLCEIIIAYHRDFQFDLGDQFDPSQRRIGIYAASLWQLLNLSLNDAQFLPVPDSIKSYIDGLNSKGWLRPTLEECRDTIIQQAHHHSLFSDHTFEPVDRNSLYTLLDKWFRNHFPQSEFRDYVTFLAPDEKSQDLSITLLSIINQRSAFGTYAKKLGDNPPLCISQISQIANDLKADANFSQREQQQIEEVLNQCAALKTPDIG